MFDFDVSINQSSIPRNKAPFKMKLALQHGGRTFHCDLNSSRSIAIELDFHGQQPQHFGAPAAKRSPLKLGSYLGSTSSGGSCNCDVLELIPHCNGTHTETVGHIVNEEVGVGQALIEPVLIAALITVAPVLAADLNETYRPKFDANDLVISATAVKQAIAKFVDNTPNALIIRTTPNSVAKRSRSYSRDSSGVAESSPPFFSVEAMELIVKSGIEHLLVDTPSVDRMYDDGLLTNHHLFWNVPEGSHGLTKDVWRHKTITEMIFVDDELSDGVYGLSLQVPAFLCDAAPSRPIIFPLKEE